MGQASNGASVIPGERRIEDVVRGKGIQVSMWGSVVPPGSSPAFASLGVRLAGPPTSPLASPATQSMLAGDDKRSVSPRPGDDKGSWNGTGGVRAARASWFDRLTMRT